MKPWLQDYPYSWIESQWPRNLQWFSTSGVPNQRISNSRRKYGRIFKLCSCTSLRVCSLQHYTSSLHEEHSNRHFGKIGFDKRYSNPRHNPSWIPWETKHPRPTKCSNANVQTPWMDLSISYLKDRIMPINKRKAMLLSSKAAHYVIYDNKLYFHGLSLPLLKCVDDKDARYILQKNHEGICGNL